MEFARRGRGDDGVDDGNLFIHLPPPHGKYRGPPLTAAVVDLRARVLWWDWEGTAKDRGGIFLSFLSWGCKRFFWSMPRFQESAPIILYLAACSFWKAKPRFPLRKQGSWALIIITRIGKFHDSVTMLVLCGSWHSHQYRFSYYATAPDKTILLNS